MCGIAGVVCFEGDAPLARVVAMASMMRARGPDDEGYVALDERLRPTQFWGADTPLDVRDRLGAAAVDAASSSPVGTVIFGHRRLSIVDLSPAGHQPMLDPETGRWIVFNGEIYNFRELRAELVRLGFAFRSRTDTEVILAAYAHWGTDCLRRFNGDFAFAILDPVTKSLFCARDRLGVKPFYFAASTRHFIFASDIKSLLASGLHAAVPDRAGLFASLALGMAPRPMTAFQGVRALEQAHWMRVRFDGSIERHRYWEIPVGRSDSRLSVRDAAVELRCALDLAVKRRLEADVPVATFMSGGIDSTTISSLASQHHAGIKAFTLGFTGSAPEFDEVPEAEATARMWPIQHIVTRIEAGSLPCEVDRWIDGYEEPYFSLAANHVISRVVHDHGIKVVLNGLGGDELFGGYPYYQFPNWYGRLPAALRPAIVRSLVDRSGSKRAQLWCAASADRVHSIAFARWSDHELTALLNADWHSRQRTEDLLHELYASGLEFGDNIEALSFMDLMNYVGNHHVHRVDQFTMAESVEGRFPFLDHEVVELAFKIPSCCKVVNGLQKVVLREVASGLIAQSCLTMKKKGFGLPVERYLRGPLAGVTRAALKQLGSRGIFTDKALAAAREGRFSPERTWQMAAVELWFQRFIDRPWSQLWLDRH
jgi:asparagine synthase (glutamine-hydrolysing)